MGIVRDHLAFPVVGFDACGNGFGEEWVEVSETRYNSAAEASDYSVVPFCLAWYGSHDGNQVLGRWEYGVGGRRWIVDGWRVIGEHACSGGSA